MGAPAMASVTDRALRRAYDGTMREAWIGPLLALAVGSTGWPLAGCGDAPGPRAGDNAVYPANARGRIALLELPFQTEEMPSVSAFLFDEPEVPPEELVAQAGDCALYRRDLAPCGDSCDGDCGGAGICIPFPRYASAGDISVTGVVEDLALRFVEPGYYVPETRPQGDLFEPGASIQVAASGGDFPAFEMEARGVADLTDEIELVLDDDRDHTVTWTAGDDEATGFQLVLRTGWHGGPYETMLICEAPDEGRLAISRTLIRMLPRFGLDASLAPHPSVAARFTRRVVETEVGTIELLVAHMVRIRWEHDPTFDPRAAATTGHDR
jgi:hypothetical protein